MRYAIVSDIHANLQAWNAVLLDIRGAHIDKIICLGDIIGYGPNPAEVLKSVHGNVDYLVLGNHDAVVCGKMDAALFNAGAREIILWTGARLNKNAVSFLSSLPLSLDGGFFRCAHGEFSEPAAFNYVIDPCDALPSWQSVDAPLLFTGHTHQPSIFLLGQSNTPRVVEAQDFELEPDKRFLVNVGSVGQPRDGQATACYCILDADAQSVFWRRIPFDIDAYRAALNKAGLSDALSFFLRHDPRIGVPPLREMLDFSPARTPDQTVKDAVEVQELKLLRRRVIKWKLLFAAVLSAVLLAGGIACAAWWRHHSRGLSIGDSETAPTTASMIDVEKNILSVPSSPAAVGSSIPGWSVYLGNRWKQGIRVEPARDASEPDEAYAFVLTSQTRKDELRLLSPRINVEPGMRLCLLAAFRKDADFAGNIAVVASLTKVAEGRREVVDQFIVKEPNVARKDGWMTAKKTFTIPADGAFLILQVRGKFIGRVAVKGLTLKRAVVQDVRDSTFPLTLTGIPQQL